MEPQSSEESDSGGSSSGHENLPPSALRQALLDLFVYRKVYLEYSSHAVQLLDVLGDVDVTVSVTGSLWVIGLPNCAACSSRSPEGKSGKGTDTPGPRGLGSA